MNHFSYKQIVCLVIAVLFTVDSLWRTFTSNFNFGHLLIYMITLCLWIYAVWAPSIDAFCAVGAGRLLAWAFCAGVALLCALVAFVAVSGYSQLPSGNEQAVVVLGAGLRGEVPSNLLERRLQKALEYYQQNPQTVLVVTGGQGNGETIPEGVAMARWLMERGVPSQQIIVEDKSTSTEENLLFAKELMEQQGISAEAPVVVVTNAFHCYRAGQYAAMVGFKQVSLLPASISITSVLPCYLREAFAVLYYWVFKSSRTGWMLPFVGIF